MPDARIETGTISLFIEDLPLFVKKASYDGWLRQVDLHTATVA